MVDIAQREPGQLEYPYGQVSSDEETLAAALNALHHCSGVPNERVRVEVRQGRAVLSGVVEQDYERSLAQQAVSAASGVSEVINQITLAS